MFFRASLSILNELEEDVKDKGEHNGAIDWSDEATFQLIKHKKKYQNFKMDKPIKNFDVNQMIAEDMKPWVSYHEILKKIFILLKY